MAEPDDQAEAASRLEGALEQIAQLAARRDAGAPANRPVGATPDEVAVARRLDLLIARLRAVLEIPRS